MREQHDEQRANNATVIGVDIGGTKIAAGRVSGIPEYLGDQRAEVAGSIVLPTRAAEGFSISLAQVWSAIEQTMTADVEAIGICAPGPLNPKTGIILNPPNLPGWNDIPLAKMAEEKFGLPVRLENDCNAAALAEARYGAGRGHAIVFYAAIGTGIGSGIVLDGKIYYGAHAAAGEAGHMTVDYRSTVVCTCGAPGCIEALASGSAIAHRGDEPCAIAEMIGAWLGSIVSLLDPGIIVLGGGVLSGADGAATIARLREIVPTRTVNPYASAIPIMPAHFGAQAGVVGAAAVVVNG